MLYLLSPAKSLDYETPVPPELHALAAAATLPPFLERSAELIAVLRRHSAKRIAALMSISSDLANLNVQRYAHWSPEFTDTNSKPAALAFDGDVYGGLAATTLAADDLAWAQRHIAILSGLYGVLRPLDWMQPYRLEMGTALATGQGKNLYQFWGSKIADYLNQRAAAHTSPVIVNLASEEYFRAVDRKALKARVVSCVFEEFRAGKYKIISFMAKRARGLMVRYATEHKLVTVKKLEGFDAEGYRFDPAASEADRLVFRRRQAV